MQQRLYTRVEFARLAGVTKQAVGKACRAKLGPACVGMRVDAAHPVAVAYLAAHGVREAPPLSARARPSKPVAKGEAIAADASARAPTPPPKPPASTPAAPPAPAKAKQKPPPAPPAPGPPPVAKDPVRLVSREVRDVSEVADMTIRQVVAKFGTATAFKDWLASLKQIEDVHEKHLRNAETNGNLISIKLVATHMMGAIESANRRLLTDSPKTLARRCYAAAKSDVPIEEAEQMVREIISSQLKPMKDAVARLLRDPHG